MPPEEFSINMLLNAYPIPQKNNLHAASFLAQILPQNQTPCSRAVRVIPGYSGLHDFQKIRVNPRINLPADSFSTRPAVGRPCAHLTFVGCDFPAGV
jgi:hypothetical protein